MSDCLPPSWSAAGASLRGARRKNAYLVERFGAKGQDLGKAFYSKTTRGGQICFDAEPVDMATGAMVDFETDLSVPGTLPLVVDRNANSAHQLGRALGPTWVSRMDVRIEVCSHEVLMVSSDGALLTFPPAPLDGTEVRADGRPWYLSFVDGAYRVRDVVGGVTWVFSVVGEDASVRMDADQPAPEGSGDDLDREIAALLSGTDVDSSLAGATGSGVEIGVSSLVHRTGHWIDYHYDAESANMVAMVRSDGTEVTVEWNREVNRVVGLWVSNSTTHPDEQPVKVIGYEYDMAGQLVRVLNSSGDPLTYHYDARHRSCGWTDRNGASYYYVFDEAGRVVTQVGTGGMFANALVYLPDEAQDAPVGGSVCVLVETAGEFAGDPLELGDSVVADRLDRIEALPLVAALRSGGLAEAGLVGQGRDGDRGVGEMTVPQAWLSDEVLGDVRARVFRSTPAGDVWRIVETSGTCVDYAHDDEHRIVCTTGPDGSQSMVEFDDNGAVIATTFPDGSTEYIEPGSWGAPARIIGRDGKVTEAEIDDLGQVMSVTDPSGLTTRIDYQWRASGSVPLTVTGPDGLTTTLECDGAGREIARTDAAGLRSSVIRDVLGRPVETMDPAGITEQLTWSPESWLAGITHADGTGIANVYDGEGNLVSATTEIGATTTTEFTVFDKPVVATDASGAVTRLVYNTQMELAAVINADGHRWDFTRNLDGIVVAERDYNGLVTRFENDYVNRWSKQISADSTEQVTFRDVLGRPVRADTIDGTVAWDWDDTTGRLLGVSSPEATIRYTHDEHGRRVGETVRLATGEHTSVDYRVDHTGTASARTVILPDGTVVDEAFTRDDTDRITWVTLTTGSTGGDSTGVSAGTELAHLGLGTDAAGRRDRVSVGSLVRQYRYDSRGRRDGDRVLALGKANTSDSATGGSRASSVVAGREYIWRADSVVTAISDLLAGPIGLDVDELGRVTGVTRRASTDPATGGYLDPWTPASTATGPEGQTAGAKAVREFYSFTTAGVLDRVDPGTDFRDTDPTGSGDSSSTGSEAAARGKPENLARLADRTAGEHTAEARAGSTSEAVVGVDLDGTLVTRVGRTRLHYDTCGRVIRTVTRRLSRKPLVREFTYGATGQVRGFSSSDDPEYRWGSGGPRHTGPDSSLQSTGVDPTVDLGGSDTGGRTPAHAAGYEP